MSLYNWRSQKGGENRFGLVKTEFFLVETEKIKTEQNKRWRRYEEQNDEEENKINETVMRLSV